MAYTVTNNPWTSQYNVGIGTDSVDDKLHLYGSGSATQIIEGGTNDAQINYKSGGVAKFLLGYTSSADGFRFVDTVAGNVAMFIKSNDGRIGIGNTSPDELLHLTSATSLKPVLKIENTNADAYGGAINFVKTSGSPADDDRIGYLNWYGLNDADENTAFVQIVARSDDVSDGTEDGELQIHQQVAGTNTQVMTIQSGNVGIGATAPSAPLNITKEIADYQVVLNNANGAAKGLQVRITGNDTATLPAFDVETWNADTTYTSKFRIQRDGKVSIGATSPIENLHLSQSDSDKNYLHFTNQTTGHTANDGISIGMGDDESLVIYQREANKIIFGTSASTRMTILSGGNVGIGDTSPSYKLEITGTFYASGSSQAFKKNVTDLAVDSSAIYNLNPVSYNYKKDYENFGYDLAEGKQFGLISEEVAESIPELAIMKDGEPKNVDYQKLSVLLLAEMQKMNKRIKDLECHI